MKITLWLNYQLQIMKQTRFVQLGSPWIRESLCLISSYCSGLILILSFSGVIQTMLPCPWGNDIRTLTYNGVTSFLKLYYEIFVHLLIFCIHNFWYIQTMYKGVQTGLCRKVIHDWYFVEKKFWPTVRKKFVIRGWRPRICKFFEITRTI